MDKLWLSLLVSISVLTSVQGFKLPSRCRGKDTPSSTFHHDKECGIAIIAARDEFWKKHSTYDWDAISKAKQNREFPDPQEYFSRGAYQAHLLLFKKEGENLAYLVPDGPLESHSFVPDQYFVRRMLDGHNHYFPTTLGYPDGLFVSTEEAIDRLLLKAQKKGNRGLDVIEHDLGFNAGFYSNKAYKLTLLKVSFSNKLAKKIWLPSGNEQGANSLWIPGAYTPGRIPEAVIEPPVYGRDTIKIEIVYSQKTYKDDRLWEVHNDKLVKWVPHECKKCDEAKHLNDEQLREQCQREQNIEQCCKTIAGIGLAFIRNCKNVFGGQVDEYGNYLQEQYEYDFAKSHHYNQYNQFMDEYGINNDHKYIGHDGYDGHHQHHGHNGHNGHHDGYNGHHQSVYLGYDNPYDNGYENEYNYTSQLLLAVPMVLLCICFICIGYLICLAFGGIGGYLINQNGDRSSSNKSNKSNKYGRVNVSDDEDDTEDV